MDAICQSTATVKNYRRPTGVITITMFYLGKRSDFSIFTHWLGWGAVWSLSKIEIFLEIANRLVKINFGNYMIIDL